MVLLAQIGELSFWKSKTVERFLELERENDGLKERVQSLLQQQQCEATGVRSRTVCPSVRSGMLQDRAVLPAHEL
jgi:hypothetical protein